MALDATLTLASAKDAPREARFGDVASCLLVVLSVLAEQRL